MSSFRLQSGDSGFNSRVDALFSSLQTVAVDLEAQPRVTTEEDEGNEDRDRDVFRKPLGTAVGWRGRGGGPRGRAPRNTTPDYVKNPQKWTRYNMKDTQLLSDRENKQVGLELFDELRTRRIQEDENKEGECGVSDEGGSEAPKIVFKKPTKSADADIIDDQDDGDQPENLANAYFGGAKKLRMQEYVVGKPSRKRSLKKNDSSSLGEAVKESSNKQIKLGHLMFEDEEV